MALLDVTEAADFFGDGGKPDGEGMIVDCSPASTLSSIAS